MDSTVPQTQEKYTGDKGLILVNLGSPDSTAVEDVRIYLRQFLMDGKVLDIPWVFRKLIVEGFILPSRPKNSAEAYSKVWMKDGAPLKVLTEQFRQALRPFIDIPSVVAMRYRNPTPEAALVELLRLAPSLKEILLAPLYPHYAMSSYETAFEFVVDAIRSQRPDLKIRILQPFYDEQAYIQALSASVAPYLQSEYDHILFSYHGLPVRHLKKSDPTHNHCYESATCCDDPSQAWNTCYKHQVISTTKLVAKTLNIPGHKFSFSFQSRLGRDEWIKPFTKEQLEKFPGHGIKKLLVVCPAFVADCLETLEEMGIQGKESFLNAGGETFQLIPCMNAQLLWVEAFAGYVNESEKEYKQLWK